MQEILIDFNLIEELEKAAPKVSLPDREIHKGIYNALVILSQDNNPLTDLEGAAYWRASLAKIISLSGTVDLAPRLAGNICRALRCVMKRENDGYQVFWSEQQLDLLRQVFEPSQEPSDRKIDS